jgi:hypothetical protein
MRILIALLTLLFAYPTWGQQGIANGLIFSGPATEAKPALVCDQYQHLVPAHNEDCSTNMIGCSRSVPDKCVDDMHLITEREWQALMARLKALEDKGKP